ncbi:hypothetical protein AX16_001684 [Volvariella volvacea WC 439]|nr:hypothetical protein AX16_001684 [Volvariella volvacea WC 439]
MSYADHHQSPIVYEDFNLGKHYPTPPIPPEMRVSDFQHQDFAFQPTGSSNLAAIPRQHSSHDSREHSSQPQHREQYILPYQAHAVYPVPLELESQPLPLEQPEQPPQGWAPFSPHPSFDSSSLNLVPHTLPLSYTNFSAPQFPSRHTTSPTMSQSPPSASSAPAPAQKAPSGSQGGVASRTIALAGSLDPSTGVFYRTPEHPRLRTAQACEKCRTRKAKCSGEHPSCKRCITRGLACEYAKEGRVRGPNKPKQKPLAATNNPDGTKSSPTSASASNPRGKGALAPDSANRSTNATTHISSTSAAAGTNTSSRSANSAASRPTSASRLGYFLPQDRGYPSQGEVTPWLGPEASPPNKHFLIGSAHPPQQSHESYSHPHQSSQSVPRGGLAPANHIVTGRERRGSFSTSSRPRPRPPNLHLEASNHYRLQAASQVKANMRQGGNRSYPASIQFHQTEVFDSPHNTHDMQIHSFIHHPQSAKPQPRPQQILPGGRQGSGTQPSDNVSGPTITSHMISLDGLHGYSPRSSSQTHTFYDYMSQVGTGVASHSATHTPYTQGGSTPSQLPVLSRGVQALTSNKTPMQIARGINQLEYGMGINASEVMMSGMNMMAMGMNLGGMDLPVVASSTTSASTESEGQVYSSGSGSAVSVENIQLISHNVPTPGVGGAGSGGIAPSSGGMTAATTPATSASLTCPSTSAPSTPIHLHHQIMTQQQQQSQAQSPPTTNGSANPERSMTLSSSPSASLSPQQAKQPPPPLPPTSLVPVQVLAQIQHHQSPSQPPSIG